MSFWRLSDFLGKHTWLLDDGTKVYVELFKDGRYKVLHNRKYIFIGGAAFKKHTKEGTLKGALIMKRLNDEKKMGCMLPSEIISQIFSHMDFPQRAVCREVCTEWRDIIDASVKVHPLDFIGNVFQIGKYTFTQDHSFWSISPGDDDYIQKHLYYTFKTDVKKYLINRYYTKYGFYPGTDEKYYFIEEL